MKTETRIFHTAKGKRSRFARIDNTLLQDKRLTFRARGVLAYLLSKPEDWRFSAASLASEEQEGCDALERTIRELESLGYVKRERRRGREGQFATILTVHEAPIAGFPAVGEPAVLQTTESTDDCRNHRKEEDTSKALTGLGDAGKGRPFRKEPAPPGTIKNPTPLPKSIAEVESAADVLGIAREVARAFAKYQAAKGWAMNGRRLVNWKKAMQRWADTDTKRIVRMDKMDNEAFWKWVDEEGLEHPTVCAWIRLNEKNKWKRINKITGRNEPISDWCASCLAFCQSELVETLERIGHYEAWESGNMNDESF